MAVINTGNYLVDKILNDRLNPLGIAFDNVRGKLSNYSSRPVLLKPSLAKPIQISCMITIQKECTLFMTMICGTYIRQDIIHM
jgi:hypothetical protein